MKEALRFGSQFISLEKGSSVGLEGRGYHNSTLLQAIKCQFNSAFQHSLVVRAELPFVLWSQGKRSPCANW